MPCVKPPPTPEKTGISAASIMPFVIAGCGVKGYTAITACASVLRIIAISVVKIIDFILRPKILMPLAFYNILFQRRHNFWNPLFAHCHRSSMLNGRIYLNCILQLHE